MVRARTWGWTELTEMLVNLLGPVRMCDMYPPFDNDLPPVSFRYPLDLLLAQSASSSPPAASSTDVPSWNMPWVRTRLFALDIPELT